MKRAMDIARAVVISPEMVFTCILAFIVYFFPAPVIVLASRLNTSDEPIKFLALLSPAVTAWMVINRNDLLFATGEQDNRVLLEWPGYHMLLDRFWICVFFGALGSVAALGTWFFRGDLTNQVIFAVFFGGVIVPLIATLSFVSATTTLRRVISTRLAGGR